MITAFLASTRPLLIVGSVLTAAYLAGVIGLQIPALHNLFVVLTPLNLMMSVMALLWFHTDWRASFAIYAMLAMSVGYGVEVIGVKTGLIFGEYAYGPGLGPQLLGVPPVIGLNWLMLTYCCGSVCDRIPTGVIVKAVLGASLLVAFDVVVEPVAVALRFWMWFGQPVPLQNYVGWWLVSFGLLLLWFRLPFQKQNPLAIWLFALQFAFFILHTVLFRLMEK
jgi:uncharacterized membrane protein